MEQTQDAADLRQYLSRTPATVRSLVEALDDDALNFRESEGAWTVLEVLCHLADGEIQDWIPRVRIVLSPTGTRRFTPFDREAGQMRYRGWSAAQLLDEFERLRIESLATLASLGLQPPDLQREGIHPEFGPVTLAQLLACWITHDYAHLAQISRILVRYRGRDVGPWKKYFSLLREA